VKEKKKKKKELNTFQKFGGSTKEGGRKRRGWGEVRPVPDRKKKSGSRMGRQK